MIRTPLRKLLQIGAVSGSPAVEDTASGNPAVFLTDLAKPLRQLKVNFLPIQASGTPSPENILPITGWDAVNVNHAGANIANLKANNALNAEKLSDGSVHYYGTTSGSEYPIEIKRITVPAGKYTWFIDGFSSTVGEATYTKDGAWGGAIQTGRTITLNKPTTIGGYIRIESGEIVDQTVKIMLVVGETVGASYEAPVTPSEYSATFPSTIYGGYIDLVTGEVWKTFETVSLASLQFYMASNGIFYFYNFVFGDRTNFVCNAYKTEVKAYWNQMTDMSIMGTPAETKDGFRITDSDYTDETAFRNHLSEIGATLAYPIATPTLITTLTPQQITALIGNNTVWSDANGDCEIKFLKKG